MRAASPAVRIGGARVARPRGASGNAGAKRAPAGTSETCDRTGIAGRDRAEIFRRGFSVDHAEPRRRGDRTGGRDAYKAFTRRRSRENARIEHGQSARVQLNIGVVPDVDPMKKSFVLALGTSDYCKEPQSRGPKRVLECARGTVFRVRGPTDQREWFMNPNPA